MKQVHNSAVSASHGNPGPQGLFLDDIRIKKGYVEEVALELVWKGDKIYAKFGRGEAFQWSEEDQLHWNMGFMKGLT